VNTKDTLDVPELAQRCAEEMARYQRRQDHDPRFCYELFRHALVQQSEEAWAAIYDQYHRLVKRWLGRASSDKDVLTNQVFARFWKAVTPDRFDAFPSLGAILAYLKRCTQSVAIDANRKKERKRAAEAALLQARQTTGESSSMDRVLDEIVSERLYAHATKSLNGTQESLAFRASYEWGLKPAEIARRWTAVFADAREVSRVKERILRRLRRDQELFEQLGMTRGDGE
jgi:DNA-directed RNA polymerase specialized sigma24 family protein